MQATAAPLDGYTIQTSTFSYTTNSVLPNSPTSVTTSTPIDGIYPLWDDLQRGIAGRGHVLTKRMGEPGSQIFIIHWDGYTFGTSGGEASFQLVLKETGDADHPAARAAAS